MNYVQPWEQEKPLGKRNPPCLCPGPQLHLLAWAELEGRRVAFNADTLSAPVHPQETPSSSPSPCSSSLALLLYRPLACGRIGEKGQQRREEESSRMKPSPGGARILPATRVSAAVFAAWSRWRLFILAGLFIAGDKQ